MTTLLGAFRDLNRLRQIYLVLVRHGFGEVAARLGLGAGRRRESLPPAPTEALLGEEASTLTAPEGEAERGEVERRTMSLPERARLVLMDLGPSFVKLGQIASTRPDLLPGEWIRELKKLQDEVTPLPFEEIRLAVETALGAPLGEVFERFDEAPLAAASIGQVHRARLLDGGVAKEVVVKVQRPGVRETVARDLELLHLFAALVERAIPESKLYSPVALVDQFERAITSELDFKQEAEHAARFAQNFADNPTARFPEVHKRASTSRVLTIEFFNGHKVYEAVGARGFSGPGIAKLAVGILVKMIFEDGFFHADPHPGNLFILGTPAEPAIGFIDLGMVGRLSPELRDKTIDLMIAAIRQDHGGVADALYAISTPTRKVDMRAYRAEVSILAEKYLGRPLKEIQLSAMIADLVQGATKYGLEIPPDFLLVGKALMTVEGVGKELDPDLDVYGEARPYFVSLLRRRYSPERLTQDLYRGLERLGTAAYELPPLTREILDDLRLGRLNLVVSDPARGPSLERLSASLFAGLTLLATTLGGAIILTAHPREPIGFVLLGLAALTLSGALTRRALERLRGAGRGA